MTRFSGRERWFRAPPEDYYLSDPNQAVSSDLAGTHLVLGHAQPDIFPTMHVTVGISI